MVLRTVNVPTVSNPWMTWSVLERLQLFIQLCHTLVCMLFLIDAADMQCMYASVSLLLASQKASNCSFNFATCSLIIAADMSILPLYPYQEHKVQYLYFFSRVIVGCLLNSHPKTTIQNWKKSSRLGNFSFVFASLFGNVNPGVNLCFNFSLGIHRCTLHFKPKRQTLDMQLLIMIDHIGIL